MNPITISDDAHWALRYQCRTPQERRVLLLRIDEAGQIQEREQRERNEELARLRQSLAEIRDEWQRLRSETRTTKTLAFELKDVTDAGEFEGLAAVYGVKDDYGDILEPGAFSRDLVGGIGKIPLLWNHKIDEPIGIGLLTDTPQGLKILGKLNLAVEKAREIYALLKQGAVTGLSIGFTTIDAVWKGTTRYVKDIKLFEVSVTAFPAQASAIVSSVKRTELEQLSGLYEEMRDYARARG